MGPPKRSASPTISSRESLVLPTELVLNGLAGFAEGEGQALVGDPVIEHELPDSLGNPRRTSSIAEPISGADRARARSIWASR